MLFGALSVGLMDKHTWKSLRVPFPWVPTFYTLPKTQKNLDNPLGKSIVSEIGSISKNAIKFVDCYLVQHVTHLPLFNKDTTDLLRILEGMVIPTNTILVAIDIKALYWSIPHEAGIHTTKQFLIEQDRSTFPLNVFILQLLQFILIRNVFLFSDPHYLQVEGVAFGTFCLLFPIVCKPVCHNHILMWPRYINDVLVIWPGTRKELGAFMLALGTYTFNLKFTL